MITRQLKKLLSLIFLVTTFKQAFRYLDPGTGSMIAQVLVAIIAGSFTTFIMFRDQILQFLGLKKAPQINDDDVVTPKTQDDQ